MQVEGDAEFRTIISALPEGGVVASSRPSPAIRSAIPTQLMPRTYLLMPSGSRNGLSFPASPNVHSAGEYPCSLCHYEKANWSCLRSVRK